MIKVDITISLGGKDTKISYAEGEILFEELALLYSGQPTNPASIYGDAFSGIDDQRKSPQARTLKKADTCKHGECSDQAMDWKDFKDDGKASTGTCPSDVDVPVSSSDYVMKNEHLDATIADDEPEESIESMQQDIDARIAAMKQAVDNENNK